MSETKHHEPVIIDRRTTSKDPESITTVYQANPEEFTKDELESLYSGRVVTTVERTYDDPCPIFNYILIRRNAKETVWQGTRFVIPESAQQSPNRGVVVAIAPTYFWEGKPQPMSDVVNPGDLVTFSAFNTEPVMVGDETYALCQIWDVKILEKSHFAVAKGL
jgi:co-chaperonin GroES (HSP10)